MTQFAVLASLLFLALGRRPWWVLAICIAYASTDEFHQSFVPSRVGSVGDVLIDTVGASLVVGSFFLWDAWRKRKHRIAVLAGKQAVV